MDQVGPSVACSPFPARTSSERAETPEPKAMLESSIDDDGEKWAQEAPRTDGHRGAEVRKRVRTAGDRAGRAPLFAWRHRERLRALDGTVARRSAQPLCALAAGESVQRR